MGAMGDLAGMGFWLFLAAVVVGGMWFDNRKRESQQETLRRVVESGQKVEQDVIDKILAAGGGSTRADRDLKIAGLITMFVAPGLLLLGWFMSKFNDKILIVMQGVALLVAFVGVGLFVAGKAYERWYREDKAD